MEISFGNKGIYHYIDAKVGGVEELEASGWMYKVQMLVENHLHYVLHSDILCTNGELWLTHNTEQCYGLRNVLLQGGVDGGFLRNMLHQILACMEELQDYLLDASDLVLRADYMFYNPVDGSIRLLCVPGYQQSVCEQLRMLLEYIMPRFDHTDFEGERMLYQCYQIVTDEWQGLPGLIRFLEASSLDEGKSDACSQRNSLSSVGEQKTDVKNSYETELEASESDVSDTVFSKRFFLFVLAGGAALALIIKYLFFDGTIGTAIFGVGWLLALIILIIMTVREKEDDSDSAMREYAEHAPECEKPYISEYVSECEKPYISEHVPECEKPYISEHASALELCSKLVPLTNGTLEPLCFEPWKETIIIGRDKRTDYRVQTTQISRMHAKLHIKDDGLFLEDLNSTNGTFINSKRISALMEYRLNKGDVIGFANEEFFVS